MSDFPRSVLFVGAATALASSLLAAPAHAEKPVKEYFDDTSAPFEISGICDFPLTVLSRQVGYAITSADGRRTTVHITEQDAFTANGATLQSEPFTFTIHVLRNADGTVVQAISTGQIIVVPIGPGVTFRAAGRFDFVTADSDFVVVPEAGGSQNQSAFCAALAP